MWPFVPRNANEGDHMSVCLFKSGKRVVVYAPDHKHYTGTVAAVTRRGTLVRVRIDATCRAGEYAGTSSVHVNARIYAP